MTSNTCLWLPAVSLNAGSGPVTCRTYHQHCCNHKKEHATLIGPCLRAESVPELSADVRKLGLDPARFLRLFCHAPWGWVIQWSGRRKIFTPTMIHASSAYIGISLIVAYD